MGLYQIVLSTFAVLLTISCSGTPITLSRMITKDRATGGKNENSIITAGFTLTLILALPLFLTFTFGHKYFNFIFTDNRAMNLFLIILPSLIFNSIYAVMRGVFWGKKDFLPYSAIELLEEALMILVGIILISKTTDVYVGTERAIIAVLISYLFSFTLSSIYFFIRGGRLKNPKNNMLPLAFSAIPVTAMKTANSFINSLVSILLPLRLVASGLTSSQALSEFGIAFGMSMPLLFIPSTLIGSFTLVLIPEISENYYKGKDTMLKENILKAIKTSTVISCLFIPVFIAVGKEIGSVIYANDVSGKYLAWASFLMLPMGLSSLTTSILNSMGYEKRTLVYYIISAILMLVIIYVLPLFLGIYSLIVAFGVVFILTTILNVTFMFKIKKAPKFLHFIALCVLLIIPVTILGVLLKNLIVSYLGNLFTVILVSIILTLVWFSLCCVFDLVDGEKIKDKILSFVRRGNKFKKCKQR